MPSPAWYTGLDAWWQPKLAAAGGSGTVPDQSGNSHDLSYLLTSPQNGVNATPILEESIGTIPPWACTKGGSLLIETTSAIITNLDLKGSVPFQIRRTYSGSTPWYSATSWTLAVWAKAGGAQGTYIGVWNSGRTYVVGNTVQASDGQVYICNTTSTGDDPTTDGGAHWDLTYCYYLDSDLVSAHHSAMTLLGDERSNGASRTGWRIRTNNGAEMLFSSSATTDMSLGKLMADGQWHLYVVTSDGTHVKGYIDAGVATDSLTHTGFGTGDTSFDIGYRNVGGPGDVQYAEPWNGEIGDVLMWDRALSSSDIIDFYNGADCVEGGQRIKQKFFGKKGHPCNKFKRPCHVRVSGTCAYAWDPAGLTLETSEPMGGAISTLKQTLWFAFTPTVTGNVTFHTAGSTPADDYSSHSGYLDLNIAVWTGSSIGSLSEVGSVEHGEDGLTVSLTADTTYHVQVGANKQGVNGVATLAWF